MDKKTIKLGPDNGAEGIIVQKRVSLHERVWSYKQRLDAQHRFDLMQACWGNVVPGLTLDYVMDLLRGIYDDEHSRGDKMNMFFRHQLLKPEPYLFTT